MIDDIFIINPVAHAYDLRDENLQDNRFATIFREILWWLHDEWNPDDLKVPQSVYYSDWPMEVLADTLFLESDIDMAANMNLRLDSWFRNGLCSAEKNLEAATRWPTRFLTYVGVDPTSGLENCIADLEQQMEQLPNSVGLKLYPDQVAPLRSWRMDDPTLAFPLFARAQELGIKTIAIHKAVANGPVPLNPYRIDDVDGAAIEFPDLNFEIVHSGLAFVDETSQAISRFPNVYANLEITSSLLRKQPLLFDEIMGQFLMWGGPEKIIYSDGTMFTHPQPLAEAFVNWKINDTSLEKWGLEQLTKEDKALMLGGNYARIAGIDIEQAKKQIADDDYARRRAAGERPAPYSTWLNHAREVGLIPATAEAR